MEKFKESLLEGGRLILFALISWLSTEVVIDTILTFVFGVRLDPATRLLLTGGITTVLRVVDKQLHEENKGTDTGFGKEKGLSGF